MMCYIYILQSSTCFFVCRFVKASRCELESGLEQCINSRGNHQCIYGTRNSYSVISRLEQCDSKGDSYLANYRLQQCVLCDSKGDSYLANSRLQQCDSKGDCYYVISKLKHCYNFKGDSQPGILNTDKAPTKTGTGLCIVYK